MVWMIQDSKLQRKLKWGIVKTIHPDHDGVVRDVIIRYISIRPGPEPYITPFSRKSPFKTKLCAVQNLSMMYSVEEQQSDKRERMQDPMSASCEIDLMGKKEEKFKTFTIDVKDSDEVTRLLTWLPDDLEEEDVSKESLEVPHAAIAQHEDISDLRIQRENCELETDGSDEMEGTNDAPDEETDKVHVISLLNRTVSTECRTNLEGDVRNIPGSHFLGYHSVKTTSTKLYSWGESDSESAASTIVRNDSGHVQNNKQFTTLTIPDVSQGTGVEMREDRRQRCLPQLRRTGDTQAVSGTRSTASYAAGHLLLDGIPGAETSPRGPKLV